jgi:hypothetical protein
MHISDKRYASVGYAYHASVYSEGIILSVSSDPLERLKKIIDEIGLTPQNIMEFENCEIISDLMEEGAVSSVKDEELRRILSEMRRLHEGVRRSNYAEYHRAAEEIFSRIRKRDWVFRYHEAEQLAKTLGEKGMAGVKNERLRDTCLALRHVHDGIALKKASVISRMNLD